MALVLVSLVAACSKNAPSSGESEKIDRRQLNRSVEINRRTGQLRAKVRQHFKDSGCTFDLLAAGGTGRSATELAQGRSMLICRGVETVERASEIDKELRTLLTGEERENIEIRYEIRLGIASPALYTLEQLVDATAQLQD